MFSPIQLFQEAAPNPHSLEKQRKIVHYLVRYFQVNAPFKVSQIIEGGSLGMGTTTSSTADIDIVIMSKDLPKEGHNTWLRSKLENLQRLIEHASSRQSTIESFPQLGSAPPQALPQCTEFSITRFALQFKCSGLEVDLLISYDWELDPKGHKGLFALCCNERDEEARLWYSAAAVKLQVEFISTQSNEVKEVIIFMKHWAKEKVKWHNQKQKPKSYLLSLLVVRAAEEFAASENTISRKICIIGALARLVEQDQFNIAWSKNYDPSYQHPSIRNDKRIIRDPANPANNVADSGLTDWSQFVPEVVGLARSLDQHV